MEIFDYYSNLDVIIAILAAIAAGATAFTLVLPILEAKTRKQRLDAVTIEREQIIIRAKERALLDLQQARLKHDVKPVYRKIVDNLQLRKHFGTDTTKEKLVMAGYRKENAELIFLILRLATPILFFIGSAYYLYITEYDISIWVKLAICIGVTFVGIKLPEIRLDSLIQTRRQILSLAWPDALDLLVICVEAGMPVEQALQRVSREIAFQSPILTEEITLLTAELSYLQSRTAAYNSFAKRTGILPIEITTKALIQAEKFGTPVGDALRLVAQESRELRMTNAEKKAAALGPKLTVPMIVFFLPVLFFVIAAPLMIQNGWL